MHANAPHERMQGIPDGWTEHDVCEVCHGTCCSHELWLALVVGATGLMMLNFYIYAIPRALLLRKSC